MPRSIAYDHILYFFGIFFAGYLKVCSRDRVEQDVGQIYMVVIMNMGGGGSVCAFNTEAAGRVSGVQPTHLGTNRVPKTKNDLAVPG